MNEITTNTLESTEEVLARLGITVSNDEERNRFHEHVTVHKYLIDRKKQADTRWPDALASWQVQVAAPLRAAVSSERVKSAFPRKSKDTLFLEVSDHWHFLKQNNAGVTINEAAEDFARNYGNSFTRLLGGSILAPLARWMRNETRRAETIERNIRKSRSQEALELQMRIP